MFPRLSMDKTSRARRPLADLSRGFTSAEIRIAEDWGRAAAPGGNALRAALALAGPVLECTGPLKSQGDPIE